MESRQEMILEIIVKEYIKTAEPVGSEFLVEKYRLKFSPATVRAKMAELTEKDYLFQPHTSAGRVPTDKGYRFFVDQLKDKVQPPEENLSQSCQNLFKEMTRRVRAHHQLIKETARLVSSISSNLGICGFLDLEDFQSSGLAHLLKEPEFVKTEKIAEILEIYDSLDKEMEKAFNQIENGVQIFIGKENLIKDLDDFSLIISRCQPKSKRGVVGVLGPKRMNYAKNIALIDFTKNLLNKI